VGAPSVSCADVGPEIPTLFLDNLPLFVVSF